MRQFVQVNVKETALHQTADGHGFRVFFGLTKVVWVALAFTILLTTSPLAVSAKSLEEQVAEIEKALPGNTKYSPALAVQSWEMAATIAHIQRPASCPTAKLINTKVTAVQQKVVFTKARKLKQGRWSEIWTFDKCGKRIRVRANFKADGKGTADGEFAVVQ